jgi:hypothetical protein
MVYDEEPRDKRDEKDQGNRPGAEGGASESTDRPPPAPADDDAPVGDTDQHSSADA